MKILLVSYDNDNTIPYFPLGLGYVAAAIRNAGHEVKIYQQDIYHYPPAHLTDYLNHNHFDAVGLGACGGYYQYQVMKNNCAAINASTDRPMIWLGGHLPSPEPEYFLRTLHADFVVLGEGELSTVALLDQYEKSALVKSSYSDVRGIAYLNDQDHYVENIRMPLIQDVDSISYPAYDLFEMEPYFLYPVPNKYRKDRTMVMLSGRGCPFKCNFCYRMDEGFRPRSTSEIVKEIQTLKSKFGITYIAFWDELLMSSIKRTYEICNAFLEANLDIHWNCNGRLNFACKDVELLKLMKRAGCVFINYGIESMDDQCLKLMNKNLTTEMIVQGVENTLAAGISPGLNIIFGNFGENRGVIEKDVEFLLKYDDHAQLRTIRPVTPYPGTDLYKYAVQKGLIANIKDFYENKHTNSDLLTCNFTDMSDEEFYECLHWANSILLEHHLRHLRAENKKVLDKHFVISSPNLM